SSHRRYSESMQLFLILSLVTTCIDCWPRTVMEIRRFVEIWPAATHVAYDMNPLGIPPLEQQRALERIFESFKRDVFEHFDEDMLKLKNDGPICYHVWGPIMQYAHDGFIKLKSEEAKKSVLGVLSVGGRRGRFREN
ncbi:hypothetical protein PENTCL1PPCAC_9887, partial [Pristionchus entomophagus]